MASGIFNPSRPAKPVVFVWARDQGLLRFPPFGSCIVVVGLFLTLASQRPGIWARESYLRQLLPYPHERAS